MYSHYTHSNTHTSSNLVIFFVGSLYMMFFHENINFIQQESQIQDRDHCNQVSQLDHDHKLEDLSTQHHNTAADQCLNVSPQTLPPGESLLARSLLKKNVSVYPN